MNKTYTLIALLGLIAGGASLMGGTATVYKDSVTGALTAPISIPSGQTLEIKSGATLLISGTLTGSLGGAINGVTLAGSGTLNVGSGGTLGTAAFTDASAYEVPLTFSGALSRSGNTITVGAGTVTNAMLAGSIDLASKVTGTLPLGNGGTGQTTAQASLNALAAASGAMSAGDLLYFDGTNMVRLAKGSTGQYLKTGTTPSWDTPAGGGGGGKLVNYAYSEITATSFESSGTWTTIASISITPSSASNLVKFEALLNLGLDSASYPAFLRVLRNGSQVHGGTPASNRPGVSISVTSGGTSYGMTANAINFIDAPASTSAVTYDIQVLTYASGYGIGINRSSSDADISYYPRGASQLMLFELAP